MNILKKLNGVDFQAEEYARDPEGVLARAAGFAGDVEDMDELKRILETIYEGKRAESVIWEPMCGPVADGDRLTGRIDGIVVSGVISLSPKKIGVCMDLPRREEPLAQSIQMMVPILFTEDPWERSPANDYAIAAARKLLLDAYYGSLVKNA